MNNIILLEMTPGIQVSMFILLVLMLLILAIKAYRYFSKTEEFDLEGELIDKKEEDVSIIHNGYQSDMSFGQNQTLIIHEYSLKIKNKEGNFVVIVEADLFKKISALGKKVNVKLHCIKTLWSGEIRGKKLLMY